MFLPILASVLFMIGSIGPITVGSFLAGATFVLLASGIVVGAMRMSKDWEEEPLDDRRV